MKKQFFSWAFILIPGLAVLLMVGVLLLSPMTWEAIATDYAAPQGSPPDLPAGVVAGFDSGNGAKVFLRSGQQVVQVYGNCSATACDQLISFNVSRLLPVTADDLVGNQTTPAPVYSITNRANGWKVQVFLVALEGEGNNQVAFFQVNVLDNGGTLISDRAILVVAGNRVTELRAR